MASAFTLRPPSQSGHPDTGIFNFSLTKEINATIVNIKVAQLHHYHNHPFKIYPQERLESMCESIRANGILSPLIVQPVNGSENEFEILAGHNRFESAKKAGLAEVPCIVKRGLSADEAYLIVTETNLIQRGVPELSHSERAKALSAHYNAIKRQGKRTDLMKELDIILSGSEEEVTSAPGQKSLCTTGTRFDVSKASVARYVRLGYLIEKFHEILDSEKLSIRAAIELSFLSEQLQSVVYDIICMFGIIPSHKQAKQIRILAESGDGIKNFSDKCKRLLCQNGHTPLQSKNVKFKFKRTEISDFIPKDLDDFNSRFV